MNKELHLILLWQNARYKEKEILEDIQKTLKISECIEIEWNKENVASNFTRFYGVKLPNRSFKEKECGRGKFLLITVWDENPNYEYVETSRGFEKVNTNIFYLKDRYRSWTRGGHKVHSTNTVPETNHDITLLLGKNYEDYVKEAPLEWNGQIRAINRDITGCDGWNSFEELFYTLNATVNYVVLRGIEDVNYFVYDKNHGDIDIFTDNYENLVYIINGKPFIIYKDRPKYKIKIKEQTILLDLWSSKKHYYDTNWQKNMLKTRQFSNGLYKLNDENTFYEMIYHCSMHKKKVADIYYEKVKNLFKKLGFESKYNLCDYKYPFDLYFKILNDFMKQNRYSFIKPIDLSVVYNEKYENCEQIAEWLKTNYNISDIKPYLIGVYNTDSGYQFFTGKYENKSIFIKWGGILNSSKNEYHMGKLLYNENNKNFIKPVLFNCNDGNNFVANELIEGVSLSNIIKGENLSTIQKRAYVKQLEDIASSLQSSGILHRDITPDNLIVTKDGLIKLIDMQFATKINPYKIEKNIIKNWYKLKDLGGFYRVKVYCWDDMYSINKIICEMGENSPFIKNLVGKYRVNLFYLRILLYMYKIVIYIYRFFKKLCKIFG